MSARSWGVGDKPRAAAAAERPCFLAGWGAVSTSAVRVTNPLCGTASQPNPRASRPDRAPRRCARSALAARPHDEPGAALRRHGLAVHEVARDVDGVARPRHDRLGAAGAELDEHLAVGDVGVGRVVAVVVPAGVGAAGEHGVAAPHAVVGEGLAALHPRALLGVGVGELLAGHDLGLGHRDSVGGTRHRDNPKN